MIICFLLLFVIMVLICRYAKHTTTEGLKNFNVARCSSKDNKVTLKDGSLNNYHSCRYKNPSYKDKLKGLFINNTSDFSPEIDYNYSTRCPLHYKQNIEKINKSVNKRQYAGYSSNGYIARTKYMESDKPLPVNPDFFMKGGGTFA